MKSDIKITDNRLEMTRIFDAPRERVFEAWKEVELIQQWWGCAQTKKVRSEIDFRTGGTFTHVMDIEGCGEHPYSGTFDEIIEPEKIAFHVELDGTVANVTIQFIEQGSQTKLILVQEGFPQLPDMDLREIISQGFGAAFEKLEKLLKAELV